MSHVQIHCDADGERTHPVFRELADRLDAVRMLAFDRFSKRGTQPGSDLDDWIAAEREVMGWPAAELKEHEGAYEVDVTLPGFDPKDVEVTATPNEVVIHATVSTERSGKDETVIWSEFGRNEVYRRFDLPTSVNADQITASLDNGILRVMAPKLVPSPSKQTDATAAASPA
ncbi:MAG: Hsp20/alpha crystallin family protein [Gemmatimonadetes bacterium]|nr:Hsp20/alpha crystallin family protein [Gemmatimonadota bacterium]